MYSLGHGYFPGDTFRIIKTPNQNGSSILSLNLEGREPTLFTNITAVIPGCEVLMVFFSPFYYIHTHTSYFRDVLLMSRVFTPFLKGPRTHIYYNKGLGPFKELMAAHESREGLIYCQQASSSPAHSFEPLVIRTITKLVFFIFHWYEIQLRGLLHTWILKLFL